MWKIMESQIKSIDLRFIISITLGVCLVEGISLPLHYMPILPLVFGVVLGCYINKRNEIFIAFIIVLFHILIGFSLNCKYFDWDSIYDLSVYFLSCFLNIIVSIAIGNEVRKKRNDKDNYFVNKFLKENKLSAFVTFISLLLMIPFIFLTILAFVPNPYYFDINEGTLSLFFRIFCIGFLIMIIDIFYLYFFNINSRHK